MNFYKKLLVSFFFAANFVNSVKAHYLAEKAGCALPLEVFTKHFGIQAATALKEGHKTGEYYVRALEGEIAGVKRRIVLLGETHLKNAEADAMGKEIVNHFSVIGYEGNRHKSILIRLTLRSLNLIYKFTLNKHRKSLIDHVNSGSLTQDVIAENFESFHLEKGHVPDFTEKAAMTPFYILISAGILHAALKFMDIEDKLNIARILSTLAMEHMIIGQQLLRIPEIRKSKYSWLVFPFMGFTVARNKTMVRNIKDFFEARPDVGTMLIIVGEFHVDGIHALLTDQKNNFRDITDSDVH